MADSTPTSAPSLILPSTVRRPRPFSLAAGLGFVTIGLGSIIDTWTSVESGAIAALALLLGGCGALTALLTRRAPSPPDGQE